MTPRTVALLYRIARLAAEVVAEEGEPVEADLRRALRDLDGAEPGWRERTPLRRSSNDRKGITGPSTRRT